MPAPDALSVDILSKLVGTPRAPLILDARDADDYPADARDLPDAALIEAMAAHPIVIERPIVVAGDRARLGRPPEAVLEIL